MADRRLLSGVCWSATQNAAAQVVSFVAFLIMVRLLTPDTFGLMAMVYVFIYFADIFIDQGFSEAIIQRRRIRSEHLDTAFWCSLIFGIVCVIVGVFGSRLVAAIFHEPTLAPIIAWTSLGFLAGSVRTVPGAILRRRLKFKVLAITGLIGTTVGGCIGVGMALAGYGVWSLVGLTLATALVRTIGQWIVAGWLPGMKFRLTHLREFTRFGANIVGFNLCNFFNRRGDDLVIGIFLGAVSLGLYTVAYRVLLALTRLLIQTFNAVTFPLFSSLQQQGERLRKAYGQSVELNALVAFPGFLAVSGMAPDLIDAVCGPEWHASGRVLRVLALVGIVQPLMIINDAMILAMGKPQWRMIWNFSVSVLNILLFLVVVQWGILAVATAYVTLTYLLFPVSIILVNRLTGIRFALIAKRCKGALAASVVMLVAIITVKANLPPDISPVMRLVILVPIGACIYLVALAVLMPERAAQGIALLRQSGGMQRWLKA